MARPSKDYETRKKRARDELVPRAKPYYRAAGPSRSLGYIKRASGPGTWIVREWAGGRYTTRVIGTADDTGGPRADGCDVLTYDQAYRKATDPVMPSGSRLTVRQAIENYLAHLESRKGAAARKDAENKLNVYVLGVTTRGPARLPRAHWLGDFNVNALTLTQLQKWQAALVRRDPDDADAERRSKDTANRVIASFKAALNHAFADEKNDIPTDKAWRALGAFGDVGRSREDHFTEAEALAAINAAQEIDPYFADLCEATFHTGARPPGELAALDVRDFDGKRGQIHVQGLTAGARKTGERVVTLTPEGVAFFKRVAAGKKPHEILLPRSDGARWAKSQQHRPMKATLTAAELPMSASMYTFRHTYISRALERGMEITTVADNVGTSVRMIEKNYRKFIAQRRRQHIADTAPQLRLVNVKKLHRAGR